MIVYIALCDKNGIIDRVIRNIPIGSINEGQNIRDFFEDSEKIDSLLTQTHSYGVSSQLRLKSGKNPFVYITIMTLKDKCLVFIYDIESPDQLTLLTETALSILNVPEITGNESYESGYYEIQKLNSQLINYQRTLAKTNARLQGLLEEAHAAKCTIEELERDTLTGLYREKIFYDKAHKIISKYAESDFDIIAVDIEQFKIVNDTFGSDSGDRLLMDLAVCLLSIQSDNKVLITRARADTFFALIPREKKYLQ